MDGTGIRFRTSGLLFSDKKSKTALERDDPELDGATLYSSVTAVRAKERRERPPAGQLKAGEAHEIGTWHTRGSVFVHGG